VTSQDGKYRELVKRGSDLIWEAASLHPGTPGHVARTALIVERMRALFREATAEIAELSAELATASEALDLLAEQIGAARQQDADTVTPEPEVADHA
jgi:hypothetical protein